MNRVSEQKTETKTSETKIIELEEEKNKRWSKIESENKMLQLQLDQKNKYFLNHKLKDLNDLTISFFPDQPTRNNRLVSPFQS